MRKKTPVDYEKESKKVKGCLIHPNVWSVARKVYQLRHGKLPSSKVCVCHTCDNHFCILDTHHFLGSQLDNMRDARAKGKMWADPSYIENLRTKAKKDWDDNTLRKEDQAVRLKKQWKDPNYRSKFEIIKPGHKKSLSHITKMSESAKLQWALLSIAEREERNTLLSASRRTPEARKAASIAAKKRWKKDRNNK